MAPIPSFLPNMNPFNTFDNMRNYGNQQQSKPMAMAQQPPALKPFPASRGVPKKFGGPMGQPLNPMSMSNQFMPGMSANLMAGLLSQNLYGDPRQFMPMNSRYAMYL